VWQSAAAEGGHEKNVGIWRKDSHKRQPADCQSAAGFQPAPHLPTCPTSYAFCSENVETPGQLGKLLYNGSRG
jgi:hypothetical protein